MTEKSKTSWGLIFVSGSVVSLLALLVRWFWVPGAMTFLFLLFLWGGIAGWLAKRHGWLGGILVGLPLALFHLIDISLEEDHSFSFMDKDFLIIGVATAVVCTGFAILGGISGVWAQGARLQKQENSQ